MNRVETQERVEAAEAKLSAAMGSGDARAVAASYADDGVLLLPGRPALEGRAAIEEHFRQVFGSWQITIESETEGVMVDGDLATLRGAVVQRVRRRRWPRIAGSMALRHLLVLRRDGAGDWAVAWDTVQQGERTGGLLRRVKGLLRR